MNQDIYLTDLAYVHNQGFTDLARGSADWIIRELRTRGITKGVVLELGCGTGHTLKALSEAGYSPIGMDISRSMLEIAKKIAPAAALKRQSFFQAEIPRCSAVISVGEAINYIPSSSKYHSVARLLRRIHSGLDDDGLFIFDAILDLHETKTRYRDWHSGRDWSVQVEVVPTRNGLTRDITIFRKRGRCYRRSHEAHSVRIFDENRLTLQLEDSGFRVAIRRSYGKVRLGPGRRVFVCEKSA